jgi:Putative lumazine-binding
VPNVLFIILGAFLFRRLVGAVHRTARNANPARIDWVNRPYLECMGIATRERTCDGGGKKTPPDRQLKEVTILDRYNDAAVVKIVASDWIDYLELAKFNGDWKIINVLWELKPKPESK